MKNIIFSFAFLMAGTTMYAQTDTDLKKRLDTVETELKSVQQSISVLQASVDEVTRQNLALKDALCLQPVINEVTTKNGINYKLIEATGDLNTGEVTLTLSVLNNTNMDIDIQFNSPKAINENGRKYEFGDFQGNQEGCLGVWKINTLFAKTPMKMVIVIKSPEQFEYIKTLDLPTYDKVSSLRLLNIPIKWDK